MWHWYFELNHSSLKKYTTESALKTTTAGTAMPRLMSMATCWASDPFTTSPDLKMSVAPTDGKAYLHCMRSGSRVGAQARAGWRAASTTVDDDPDRERDGGRAQPLWRCWCDTHARKNNKTNNNK